MPQQENKNGGGAANPNGSRHQQNQPRNHGGGGWRKKPGRSPQQNGQQRPQQPQPSAPNAQPVSSATAIALAGVDAMVKEGRLSQEAAEVLSRQLRGVDKPTPPPVETRPPVSAPRAQEPQKPQQQRPQHPGRDRQEPSRGWRDKKQDRRHEDRPKEGLATLFGGTDLAPLETELVHARALEQPTQTDHRSGFRKIAVPYFFGHYYSVGRILTVEHRKPDTEMFSVLQCILPRQEGWHDAVANVKEWELRPWELKEEGNVFTVISIHKCRVGGIRFLYRSYDRNGNHLANLDRYSMSTPFIHRISERWQAALEDFTGMHWGINTQRMYMRYRALPLSIFNRIYSDIALDMSVASKVMDADEMEAMRSTYGIVTTLGGYTADMATGQILEQNAEDVQTAEDEIAAELATSGPEPIPEIVAAGVPSSRPMVHINRELSEVGRADAAPRAVPTAKRITREQKRALRRARAEREYDVTKDIVRASERTPFDALIDVRVAEPEQAIAPEPEEPVPAAVVAPAAPTTLLSQMPDAALLALGVPQELLIDVRRAGEDELLTLLEHLPSHTANALLALAVTPEMA